MTRVRSGERGSPLSLACTGHLEQGTLPKTEVMKVGGVPADVNLNFRTMTKSSSRIRTAGGKCLLGGWQLLGLTLQKPVWVVMSPAP